VSQNLKKKILPLFGYSSNPILINESLNFEPGIFSLDLNLNLNLNLMPQAIGGIVIPQYYGIIPSVSFAE